MGYVTLATMKEYLGDRVGNTSDAVLTSFIEQSSTTIDRVTDRFFTKKENVTVDFDTEKGDRHCRRLIIRNDLLVVRSLSIDVDRDQSYSKTVPAAKFRLYPLDASMKGEPYNEVRMVGDVPFPRPSIYPSVRIVGDWGWDPTPPPIIGVVEIIVGRLVARPQAPLGAAGSPDSPLGVSQVIGDTELELLLRDYMP